MKAEQTQIPRTEFDALAREKRFVVGPFISTFGDGEGEPYVPPKHRRVEGTLDDGREVWAAGETQTRGDSP